MKRIHDAPFLGHVGEAAVDQQTVEENDRAWPRQMWRLNSDIRYFTTCILLTRPVAMLFTSFI
jgi:hypothetical protein